MDTFSKKKTRKIHPILEESRNSRRTSSTIENLTVRSRECRKRVKLERQSILPLVSLGARGYSTVIKVTPPVVVEREQEERRTWRTWFRNRHEGGTEGQRCLYNLCERLKESLQNRLQPTWFERAYRRREPGQRIDRGPDSRRSIVT